MHVGPGDEYNPLEALDKKIKSFQDQLDKLKEKRTFPYVYIVVAVPVTAIFIILTIISEGRIDLTTGITGALFFSLLITCSYLVLFQPNQDEIAEDLTRKIRNLYRERSKLEAGMRGEREVAYILRWLPQPYISMHNIIVPSIRFEPQQLDHIVLGPNGVFHLETKSINGMVFILEDGTWTIVKAVQNRMVQEVIDNPQVQVERHELVLKEFFADNLDFQVPVFSILVMAHPQTLLQGQVPKLRVLRKDQLNQFILAQQLKTKLTAKQIRQVALALAKYCLDNDR